MCIQPQNRSETGNFNERGWWWDWTFYGKNEGQQEGGSNGKETPGQLETKG